MNIDVREVSEFRGTEKFETAIEWAEKEKADRYYLSIQSLFFRDKDERYCLHDGPLPSGIEFCN
ncbi:hypothetical protein EMGBS15_18620 [Filimonas sp.]|nr:hypothetical protein EMGBS15_18620 [Filimonas sp.]